MRYLILEFSARFRKSVAYTSLIVALLRLPVANPAISAWITKSVAPLAAFVRQGVLIPAAALGLPHAVSGASISTYMLTGENPYNGEVGVLMALGFGITIPPKSWEVTGRVPPGLRVTDFQLEKDLVDGILSDPHGFFVGTPTQPGFYELILIPWENADGTGATAPEPLNLTFIITGDAPDPSTPELMIEKANDSLLIKWPETNGSAYELETSSTLEDGDWVPIGFDPQLAGDFYSITVPHSGLSVSFYRLRAAE